MSPIYRKAQEIFSLSRNICTYLSYDFSELDPSGEENPNVYFSGDIVQQSVSLGPEILMAERQEYYEQRQKYADSVFRLTNHLFRTCERLENANNSGREFLLLLRSELYKFKKMHSNWRLTL